MLVHTFPQNMPEGYSQKAYCDTFKTIHLMSLTPIILLHAGAFRFVGNPSLVPTGSPEAAMISIKKQLRLRK